MPVLSMRLTCAGLGAAAALAAPAPAGAAELGAATIAPATVRVPDTREITVRQQLIGASAAETVRVRILLPRWAGPQGADPRHPKDPLGSPLLPIGEVALDGPGRLVEVSGGTDDVISGVTQCVRGFPTRENAGATVELPAGARSTLTLRFTVSGVAPFPGTRYAPTLELQGGAAPDSASPPAPAVEGAIAPHLTLSAPARIRSGRRGRLTGALDPPLSASTVVLRAAPVSRRRPGTPLIETPNFPDAFDSPRTIGRAVTDSAGRFSTTWRPSRRGAWDVWAVHPRTVPGELKRSSTCHGSVRVG